MAEEPKAAIDSIEKKSFLMSDRFYYFSSLTHELLLRFPLHV